MIKNPIQIWNDSYGFIKDNKNVEQMKNIKTIEYEDVIQRDMPRCNTVNICSN
jgi:hypothetical protein